MTFNGNILPKLIEYSFNDKFSISTFEREYGLCEPYDESGKYYFNSKSLGRYELREKLKSCDVLINSFNNEDELWKHWANNYKNKCDNKYEGLAVNKVIEWIL